ncbi:fibronectin type III domain-containing protein [Plantactinospora sp. B24E8]|uniref:fibronectin type III domain-containing protein n=1 Tax=Plantactinospora sp. B24E8 TaxID=3153567 RepID=UPI00325D31F9
MSDRSSRPARWRARTLCLSIVAAVALAAGGAPAYAAADDTEPPTTPGPVTVVEATETSVVLTWAPSTDNVGVVSYQVARFYTDVGNSYTTSTNRIEITGLRASQTSFYQVVAIDAAGNRSAYSDSVAVTQPPGDSQPPSVPGQPVASQVTKTSVLLTWARSTDNIMLNRYEILRITDDGSTVVGTASQHPPGRNQFTVTGLAPQTSYTFAVRAVDDAGNVSAPSPSVSVTTLDADADTTPPSRPGEITVVEATETSVLLTWAASTDNVGVDRYEVTQIFTDVAMLHRTTTNSIRLTNLQPSRTYTFGVFAVDAAGNRSAAPPTLRFIAPPGDDEPPTAPTDLATTVVGEETVGLTWSPSTDNVVLQRYEVVSITPDGSTVVATVGLLPPALPSTGAVVYGLSAGTTYTFGVRAVDEAGNVSPLSAPITVTTRSGPEESCTIAYDVSTWPGGMLVHMTVRNTGSTVFDDWTFGWTLPASQQLYSVWGAELVNRGGDSVIVRHPRHRPSLEPGDSATISYVASGSTGPANPILNGIVCRAG